jgi:hypothetical protein
MIHEEFEGNDGKTQKFGKCSVSITYSRDNVALGHTGINVNAGDKAPPFAYSTNLTDNQVKEFMLDVCEMFYNLNDDIFVATSKISL